VPVGLIGGPPDIWQLPQALASPAAELNAPVTAHAVANGQNHLPPMEVHKQLYLADAIGLNYPEFPDCCLLTET